LGRQPCMDGWVGPKEANDSERRADGDWSVGDLNLDLGVTLDSRMRRHVIPMSGPSVYTERKWRRVRRARLRVAVTWIVGWLGSLVAVAVLGDNPASVGGASQLDEVPDARPDGRRTVSANLLLGALVGEAASRQVDWRGNFYNRWRGLAAKARGLLSADNSGSLYWRPTPKARREDVLDVLVDPSKIECMELVSRRSRAPVLVLFLKDRTGEVWFELRGRNAQDFVRAWRRASSIDPSTRTRQDGCE
jgi:hypothetical protein